MSVSRKEVRQKKKASGKTKFYRVIAALLIVAGLGVLGFAGFQRVMVNYRQSQLRDDFEATAGFRHLGEEPPVTVTITEWQPMRLIIPAIEVNLVAVGGGDVFDRKLLDQGPTHFQMSDLPSTEGGNVAFAGHRAGRWNFFLNIDKLNEGDEIYLDVGGYRFIYLVEWVRVFDKYDWTPIDSTEYPAITLQTCEPPHVSNPDWRLMARGALDKVIIAPVEAPEAN
jgi:LPXTG-site transpeptidase (sortase) family protein